MQCLVVQGQLYAVLTQYLELGFASGPGILRAEGLEESLGGDIVNQSGVLGLQVDWSDGGIAAGGHRA